jgi:tRNA-dihydrouridine synthase
MHSPALSAGTSWYGKHSTAPMQIGNGDVTSVAAAHDLWRHTGCNGIMIGRGALQDPLLFHRIRQSFGCNAQHSDLYLADEVFRIRTMLLAFSAKMLRASTVRTGLRTQHLTGTDSTVMHVAGLYVQALQPSFLCITRMGTEGAVMRRRCEQRTCGLLQHTQ